MKKRLLNIFFALALVLGLSPVSVFAEGENEGTGAETKTSDLTAVNLVVKPKLGAKISGGRSNPADIPAGSTTYIDASETTVTPTATGNYLGLLSYWYKIPNAGYTGVYDTDKDKLQQINDVNEVFQDGYHYYVDVLIYDFSDGDSLKSLRPFKENITGTINGNKNVAVSRLYDDKYLSIASYVDVLGFYNIDVDLTEPTLGGVADYEPTFAVTDDISEEKADLGITSIKATTWYKIAEDDFTTLEDSEWVEMEEDEEYAKGYFYMVKFDVLETNNNPQYDYLYRTISKNLTGTLNEEDFDKIVVADDQYSAELYKLYEPFGGRKKVVSAQEVANPKTADEGNLAISLLLLSVTGGAVAAVAILGKRR